MMIFDENQGVSDLSKYEFLCPIYVKIIKFLVIWHHFDSFYVKFGLSEKHKNLKQLPHGFDKSAVISKRQNHGDDFFKLCELLKKSELYGKNY